MFRVLLDLCVLCHLCSSSPSAVLAQLQQTVRGREGQLSLSFSPTAPVWSGQWVGGPGWGGGYKRGQGLLDMWTSWKRSLEILHL